LSVERSTALVAAAGRVAGHHHQAGDVVVTGIGIWDGLLCVQDTTGRLTFLALPAER
jgi:hypothetical protein